MTNKELIAELAKKNGLTKVKATEVLAASVEAMLGALDKGTPVQITNFGTMETRKKDERISVNPTTKERTLIPPKLALAFKPTTRLKNNAKNA